MSSIVVHFPDGSREFRFPSRPLEDGDIVWHNGQRYRVVHVTTRAEGQSTATVEVASDDLGDVLRSEEGAIQLVPVD